MSADGVAVQFVRAAIASTESAGIDVRGATRDTSLWRELARPGTTHIGCEQAVTALRGLLRLTRDELFLLGPRPVPPGTFRMISLGLIHAPDLRTALERLVEFASITTGYSRSRLVVDGTACRIEIAAEPGADVPPLAAEIMLAFAHRFPAWLAARRIPLTGVELPFPEPGYSAEYLHIFGRAPSFDAPVAAVSFDAGHLAAPVVREERELLSYLQRSPADLIHHRDYGTTTADRVRNILERGDTSSRARAEDVAARLSISVPHLRRLLRREGTSFHRIREEVLRDLAIAGLRRGDESVDELSSRLGFSEPSAFRRAFTRWVGSPPGEYRDRHAALSARN
ncbi:AraC family transcriptional regulator ligand-binding domain-containing protein [Nonomuraea sp. MTCD27]|uniref:AraC family transcriptional regulator n=1 Tax=Nonomuraea sp. MTCD27 TaxID=1676747 RepID=UPI0035C09795